MMNPIRVAILTASDRCSVGQTIDTAGPALADLCRQTLGATIVATCCLPDDRQAISTQLLTWATEDLKPDLILTTGGTGLSPRDVTPEATLDVLHRRHAGLLELARLRCLEKTPLAFLSRGEAGTIAHSLIINLPGSQRGAMQTLQSLVDILPHAIAMLRGDVATHEDDRPTPPTATEGLR